MVMKGVNRWDKLSLCDGSRIPVLDAAGVPKGWVVDGTLPSEIRNKIKAMAIPLRVGGLNIVAQYKASVFKRKIERRFQKKVCTLLIPHDRTLSGFFWSPVFLDDFEKSPDEIREEMIQASNNDNERLVAMKECMWLLLTGHTDPE